MAEKRPSRRAGRWLLLLALLAAAVLLLRSLGPGGRPPRERGGGGPAAGAEAPVRGRVLMPDGSPAGGVLVEASFDVAGSPAGRNLSGGSTGADGLFAFPDAPARWEGLRLRASRGALAVEADLGGAPGPLDVTLRMPSTFRVGGLAIGAEDGRPLAGLEVRFGDRITVTDELGRFLFEGIPAVLLSQPMPDLAVTGKGRKPIRRALPVSGGLDDLLLRVERE